MASTASKKPGAIKARDGFTSRTLDEPPAEPRPGESALVADGRPQAQDDPSLKGSFPAPFILRRFFAPELNAVHRRQRLCREGIEQHGRRRGQHEVIRCGRDGWSACGIC